MPAHSAPHMRLFAAGKRAPMYVKCLVVGGQLLVHWVAGASAASEPHTVELDTAAFTTDAPAPPDCYKDMAGLVAKLRWVGWVRLCALWPRRWRRGRGGGASMPLGRMAPCWCTKMGGHGRKRGCPPLPAPALQPCVPGTACWVPL